MTTMKLLLAVLIALAVVAGPPIVVMELDLPIYLAMALPALMISWFLGWMALEVFDGRHAESPCRRSGP
jgi:hypothetical protein